MSNVDALLKDGNLNVSVEVLVAVPNPLPQKPPLHPMSLPAISEVAEGVPWRRTRRRWWFPRWVSREQGGFGGGNRGGFGGGDDRGGFGGRGGFRGGSKIEETVVLVDLANNKADLAVQEAQEALVGTVDREEGMVAVVAASGKFSFDTHCASVV